MAGRFSKARSLFQRLARVEGATHLYVNRLQEVQATIRRGGLPPDLRYVAPSEDGESEELKELADAQRAQVPRQHQHWARLFDVYHRLERDLRSAIDEAKVAAGQAATEIDGPPTGPATSRASAQIRLALQNLGGVVPHPMQIGDFPPLNEDLIQRIGERHVVIQHWANQIRVLFHPEPLPRQSQAKQKKQRKRAPSEPRPLTARQMEVYSLAGDLKGNLSSVARALKLDQSTVRQHYQAALKKLGVAGVKAPKTRRLPVDRRGQVNTDKDLRRG